MNSSRAQAARALTCKVLSILTVALAAALLSATTLSAHFSTEQKKASATRPDAAQTKKMYEQNCARCHGADGRGQTKLGELYEAPDLTDGKRLARTGDKRLAAVIAQGKGGMPSFSKKLSPVEIAALVKYVRTLRP